MREEKVDGTVRFETSCALYRYALDESLDKILALALQHRITISVGTCYGGTIPTSRGRKYRISFLPTWPGHLHTISGNGWYTGTVPPSKILVNGTIPSANIL